MPATLNFILLFVACVTIAPRTPWDIGSISSFVSLVKE
jgi:hypothetical protein